MDAGRAELGAPIRKILKGLTEPGVAVLLECLVCVFLDQGELAKVAAAINGCSPFSVTTDEAVHTTAVMEVCTRSVETGKPENVSL